jgi:uncharacterized protein (DUF1330 family)
MAAYLVFIRERMLNQAEFDIYSEKVKATLEGQPVTIHAYYGKHEVLEGPPAEGVVIVSFPTSDEAKAWYDGPEYKKIRGHRFKGAEYRAILVEGVPT